MQAAAPLILATIFWPFFLSAQTSGPPPIAAPLVREGDYAVRLAGELRLGRTTDEIQAETQLGDAGISPQNGWIADYPVTPDVLGELQNAVIGAARSGRLPMSADEALRHFIRVNDEFDVSLYPYAGEPENVPGTGEYPTPSDVTQYYAAEGPPIVTYYTPPPDYYYLYAWVPYPFWCCGFWYPGFFILHDFHRNVLSHNRVAFVSNHFNDRNRNRVFRVDPVQRFHGRTFAGIGAPRSRSFVSTGVPRSGREIFNAPRERIPPGVHLQQPPQRSRPVRPPSAPMQVRPPAQSGERPTAPSRPGPERKGPPVPAPRPGGTAPHAPGPTGAPPGHPAPMGGHH